MPPDSMTQTIPTQLPAEWRDFFALTKPRVMSLVIFTGLCGLLAAPGHINPVLGFSAILCIALGAGGAAALNQWWEADIDAGMKRTAARPLPAGRMNRTDARDFGVLISAASVMIMGAFPPLIGWVAVTGEITLMPVLLFAIIFMWTPPHFWALALFVKTDYANVGIPMMPVVKGETSTRRQILIYAALLVPIAAAPWLIGGTSFVYGVASLALSLAFLALSVPVAFRQTGANDTMKPEKRLFAFSIIYLFALFAALVADRVLAYQGWIA